MIAARLTRTEELLCRILAQLRQTHAECCGGGGGPGGGATGNVRAQFKRFQFATTAQLLIEGNPRRNVLMIQGSPSSDIGIWPNSDMSPTGAFAAIKVQNTWQTRFEINRRDWGDLVGSDWWITAGGQTDLVVIELLG